MKENSACTNDSWEEPILSLTIRNITVLGNGSLRQNRDWVWDWDCAEESCVGICHIRTSPSIGDTPTIYIKRNWSLRNWSFLCLERGLFAMNMRSLLFSLRIWGTETPSLIIFFYLFQVATGCWLECVKVKYFCSNLIPKILLKLFDQGLIRVPVWVHLSMRYHKKKTFENQFRTWRSVITSWL